MSLVMQTCWNNLGLNLCVVPPMSYVVTISEDNLVRSYKERSKRIAIDTGNLVSTLVNYQTSHYKVFTSLKYIK